VLDLVRPGQEADHLHRLQRRRPRIDRKGADVADHLRAQRHRHAIRVEAELGINDLVEALAGGGEIFQPVAGPLDVAPELPCREGDEQLLRIERGLAAEAAADIRRHHAQPVARHVERFRQRVADDPGNLRRRIKRQRILAGGVFGQIGAVLHGERRLAAHAKAAADPHRRSLHLGIDIAALELTRQQHVGAGAFVQQRRIRPDRGFRIDHDRQRLEIDLDQFERVFGEIAALGHHRDHRLADIAHLALRQRNQRRGVIVRHARCGEQRFDAAFEIGAGKHRHHAGRRARRRALDRQDTRMRMVAAAEGDMQHARRRPVVDVAAVAGQEARVLRAAHPRPDHLRPGREVVGDVAHRGLVSHRHPAPCAASPTARCRGCR